MAKSVKERVEKWAGDLFVEWLNDRFGTRFAFSEHLEPPEPDALYVDGDRKLYIEATEVTYDQDAAKFEGMNRAGRDDAPDGWGSLKPDGRVLSIDGAFKEFVETRLASKCDKKYPHRAALVIHHVSRLGGEQDIDRWLCDVAIPEEHPFSGIYLVADLPDGERSAVMVRVLG